MIKKEKRILYLATCALQIPNQNNRTSVIGATGYCNDMREILPVYQEVIDNLLYGGIAEAEAALQELCKIYGFIVTRIGTMHDPAIMEYMRKGEKQ